jgi:hypothetical protein
VLDATVDLLPEVGRTLDEILGSELFQAADLPRPEENQRHGSRQALPLFEGVDFEGETPEE